MSLDIIIDKLFRFLAKPFTGKDLTKPIQMLWMYLRETGIPEEMRLEGMDIKGNHIVDYVTLYKTTIDTEIWKSKEGATYEAENVMITIILGDNNEEAK